MPRLALNLVTIRQAGFERQLVVAAEAGYTGVGIWGESLSEYLQQGGTFADATRLLHQYNLTVVEFGQVTGWMFAEGKERERAFERAKALFAMAQAFDCRCVPATASLRTGPLDVAGEDYAAICRLAAPYHVQPALEFVGTAAQVKDLPTARRIVEIAGQPNGGVLLDTFHFHGGGSTLDDLQDTPAGQIILVHLTDCLDFPREQLTDLHRVFPGLGTLPLGEIRSILAGNGYQGFYCLEVFNEEYWQGDPLTVARAGIKAWRELR